jgi:tetratricopeptide (TPR) repeat protein
MSRRHAHIPRFSLALRIGMAMLATIVLLGAAVESRSVMASDSSGAIQTAQRQFNSGNYTAAIKTLQSLGQASANAEAQYWIGRCYYELRDYDNAISAAEKAVELDPKNSVYHQWLGTIYGGKADRDRSFSYARKVKKEFEEAVRLNPSNVEARRDLEQYDMEAPWVVGGSKDEAREQVTAIEAIDPVEGHLAHGAYELNAKRPELAEKEYRAVLAAKPKRVEPYLDVIRFFIHENKPADVEAAIQAAAQVSPNDPRLGYYRGASRVLAGTELPRGEEYLKSYLASSPDRSDWPSHAGAREWLGRLYEAEGKRAEAAEQYRAALQLDPGQKEAKSRLEKLEKSSR